VGRAGLAPLNPISTTSNPHTSAYSARQAFFGRGVLVDFRYASKDRDFITSL
jgi:hypothetical protein